MSQAILHIVGVGPGDPDLMTLKAARIIGAAGVVAYFRKHGRDGHACQVARPLFAQAAEIMAFEYPFTTEIDLSNPRYPVEMTAFYDQCADALCGPLKAGHSVALLCEGDPFFYGSAMYLYDRLRATHRTEIVPGITGMSGCWSRAGVPMLHGDDVLSVIPGTLDEDALVTWLSTCDAAVIMKLGRNLPKVRTALVRAGRLERAIYVERGTMPGEKILPLADMTVVTVPYFSIVLVPGRQGHR